MKSKIPCELIQDLLPLYLDNLTSDTTNKEMELHVSECEVCNRRMQLMKNPDMVFEDEEEKEIQFLKKNRRANVMIVLTTLMISTVLILLVGTRMKKQEEPQFDFASFAANAKRGDAFFFGEYEQDGILENGLEPIEWIVLKNKDNKLYVMSKYGLDSKPYHEKEEAVTWEKCSLRKWLNNDFYEAAFSEEEKEMILETELDNWDNPYYKTEGGNNTKDNVFLMSYKECEPQKPAFSRCMPTQYGELQGVYILKKYVIQCEWWLRTPGIHDKTATIGGYNVGGSIGKPVNYKNAAVRPCMNIGY